MQYHFCLPHSPLRVLRSASGCIKPIKVKLDSEDATSEAQPVLYALPPELLGEIVGMVSSSTYKGAVLVSRSWRKTLDNEIQWERLCRWQWPGVTQNADSSWRTFALLGGGDFLGAHLFHYLKSTSAEAMKCSANCFGGQCHLVEARGMHCDACGETSFHGMRVRTCRVCSYNRCDMCYKALQPPASIVNGATNHSKNGWSALHHACRLGFQDVVNSLLDSRTDIEGCDGLHGYTPLMVCAKHGHHDLCSFLLERGASRDTKNNYSKTAVDCAHSWGDAALSKLLGQTQKPEFTQDNSLRNDL